ncbi:MAG TPA: HD-GYP domain-containing protein [Actinomycetota bacterium]|nr:HD-GYP domain-containing protein [Actinomycetota bacterium]
MSTSKQPGGASPGRWKAHPVRSALLRVLVLIGPVAAGVTAGVALSRVVPRPEGAAIAGWWAALLLTSFVVTEVVGRFLRRLLPLAVLMKLTLIFPDRAPSRFAMARRVGSIRNLEERVRHAKEHGLDDDPSRAAETILELVAALSAHDRKTRGHSERVRAFADLLADALKLPQDARDRLRWSALLHDIGKLEVPGRILNKPGKPDPHEWETLQRHPEEGARLATPLLPWLGEWGTAIEQHHERYDGGGYPRGLTGDEISLGGRILTVADSFETMTAARSYKKPMSVSAARAELARCAGSQFDPALVRAFLNVALGRLWRTAGPASWVAQIPLVGAGARAVQTFGAAAARAAVGATALGVTGALPVAARDQIADRSPVPAVAEAVPEGEDASEVTDASVGQLRDGGDTTKSGADQRGDDRSEEDQAGSGEGSGGSGDEGGGGSDDGGGGSGDDPVDQVGDTVNDTVDQVGDTVNDTVDQVEDTVNDTVDQVGDTVGDVADTVGGTVKDAGDAVGSLVP